MILALALQRIIQLQIFRSLKYIGQEKYSWKNWSGKVGNTSIQLRTHLTHRRTHTHTHPHTRTHTHTHAHTSGRCTFSQSLKLQRPAETDENTTGARMLPAIFDFKSSLSGASLWIDTLLYFSTSFIFEGSSPLTSVCAGSYFWYFTEHLRQAERVVRQM